MDKELKARVLTKVQPRIGVSLYPGSTRFEVGPNSVDYPSGDEAVEALLDQALEHYRNWGTRWDVEHA